MERGFGRSLAGVRVHTDAAAGRLAAGYAARAFTVGLPGALLLLPLALAALRAAPLLSFLR